MSLAAGVLQQESYVGELKKRGLKPKPKIITSAFLENASKSFYGNKIAQETSICTRNF
ncbi:hypothetical protein YDYSY3_30350 [Paenibacillus chitinolyticus]|uniref:hypothetical protein n=1 Tax=Paenibacillus chitinolyticus TaxID=79263 RepID=UPI0026E4DAC3|nr:hypothetical protein [Paenibacillus chitinolyticus]GKS12035.1 hypothetical protein YDYSY3_30350 [Paenibacillus chitinolyticus]